LANLHYSWAGGTYLEGLTRDGAGRIIARTEAISGDTSRTTSYVYTTAGRLKETRRGSNVLEHYEYDSNGNRVFATGASLTDSASATYDDQDRMLRYKSTRYSYTANGELLQRVEGSQTTTYTYDPFGNLVTVVLPNQNRIDYLIDTRNRRVGRKLNGVLQRAWLYQNDLNPVAELDGQGGVVARYVYGSSDHVPDYVVKGDSTYRLVTDHLGTVRLVVNASTGVVAERIDYDSWGRVISDSSPGFAAFGYAGGLYDGSTGLVRFGARDYDPSVGRWMSKDPLLPSTPVLNAYEYAMDMPTQLIDPWGLHWEYSQASGNISWINDQTGERVSHGRGYSGHGEGLNNPALESRINVGPIPRGTYVIGPPFDSPLGRPTLNLTPTDDTNTFNRRGFAFHGDYKLRRFPTYEASTGCIITSRGLRKSIAISKDPLLKVVP